MLKFQNITRLNSSLNMLTSRRFKFFWNFDYVTLVKKLLTKSRSDIF